MTLDQLAAIVGVSTPHLSRIETGGRQPSLSMLYELAAAFGVSVSSLFAEEPTKALVGVFRRKHREAGRSVATGFQGSRSLDGMVVELVPQNESDPFVTHHGEEFVYVESGSVVLEIGEVSEVLRAGDTAHWDGSQPHRLGGAGVPAVVVVLSSERLRPHQPPQEPDHGTS
jgi:transcriptional regulator with XRE-family HTH domain